MGPLVRGPNSLWSAPDFKGETLISSLLSLSQRESLPPPFKWARLFLEQICQGKTNLRTESKELSWNLYANQLLHDLRKFTLRMSLLFRWIIPLRRCGLGSTFRGYNRLIASHSVNVLLLYLSFLILASPIDHTPVHRLLLEILLFYVRTLHPRTKTDASLSIRGLQLLHLKCSLQRQMTRWKLYYFLKGASHHPTREGCTVIVDWE